ncbi:hypothetical protein TNCV_3426281 [Trichonephila clavipes]|nr:hypothetical protein TNCV_3426281 [Trichonephila clavipes]
MNRSAILHKSPSLSYLERLSKQVCSQLTISNLTWVLSMASKDSSTEHASSEGMKYGFLEAFSASHNLNPYWLFRPRQSELVSMVLRFATT